MSRKLREGVRAEDVMPEVPREPEAEEKEEFTSEEYTLIQYRLGLLAVLLKDMKLKEFLATIQRTETVAPLFNPSLWMRGVEKLALMKQMAAAFYKAQKGLPSIEDWEKAQAAQEACEQLQGIVGPGE